MLAAMNVQSTDWPDDVRATLGQMAPGHAFEVPEVLFAKISDDDRDAWAERFAGTRA
jgi:methionyl-tRNA synthetase